MHDDHDILAMVSPWRPYPSSLKAYERLGYLVFLGNYRVIIQIVLVDTVMTQSELHKYIGYIDGLGRRNPKLNRRERDRENPPYDRYRLFKSTEELFLLPSWQQPIRRRMIQINDISDVNARPRRRSRLI